MNLKIGDNVIVNWETENVYRFLYGKIIDILTENEKSKYKVEYIDNLSRWESGLKVELWEKKHIHKRIPQS